MYKGRYVAVIEYDFAFDESLPHAKRVENISDFFRSGEIEKEIENELHLVIFPPENGECKVTQAYFDVYEVPKEGEKE